MLVLFIYLFIIINIIIIFKKIVGGLIDYTSLRQNNINCYLHPNVFKIGP